MTFIDFHALAAVYVDCGLDLLSGQHRRNVVTDGVRLSELVGARFRIGGALFRGTGLCEPCRYLERLTGKGAFEALRRRGGMRADVLEGGTIARGDQVISVSRAARLP